MKQLLIIANLPSENCIHCRDAIVSGANSHELTTIKTITKEPLEAVVDDVLRCDGIIIGTTENFGAMSGLIKDLFERIYYPCLEQTAGLPVAVYVKAGLDGSGTKTGVERVITGLRWRLIQPTLILQGKFEATFLDQCHNLGMTMAAGLEAGIY